MPLILSQKARNGKGGISLFTDETKETYKSTYQILKEISEIWDQLSDKNQAKLLEKLAGKRGGQVVAGLLTNFSAAEKAGVKIGDVIIEADGTKISTMDELNSIKNKHSIGDEMKIKVNRDGQEKELTLTLGEQP